MRRFGVFIILLQFLAMQAHPQSTKELEKTLRQTMIGKLSFLKISYTASHLHFDQGGKLSGSSEIGPWTTYGIIVVRNIELKPSLLRIRAERAVAALREKDSGTQLVPILSEQPLDIGIDLPQNASNDAVRSALSAMLQGGNMEERLQSYWKPNSALTDSGVAVAREHPDGVIGTLEGGRKVYMKIASSDLQLPKPIYSPDPEYTQAARKHHTQGTATIEVIINEKGLPEILEVSRSLKDGLDVKALATVAQWRFQPALKDGVAVPVKFSVEVTFRLY